MEDKLFCGVEGGASVSKLVIVRGNGEVLCTYDGPSANYLLLGIEECQKRLVDMIEKAKEKAGINPRTAFDGLGLCLSGCEEEEANGEFEKTFLRKHPNIMKSCTVASDTLSPIYSACPNGGLVLIAGTGSNSRLVNPDGTEGRCGGWGHLLGDEGSAMWISLKAVKIILDEEDNFVKCPYDISKAKEAVLQHFKAVDKFGLLEHCYSNFSKTYFAGLCARLAEVAVRDNDPLCCHLFYEAGKVLAAHAVALRLKVHKDLLESEGGLPIVCIGSVFKSWQLLKEGFVDRIRGHYDKCTLISMTSSSAIGAAFLGAQKIGVRLPIDYKNHVCKLFTYESES